MNNIKEGRQRITPELEQKYQIQRKGKGIVIEELKQRVISTAAKIKRYSDRVEQYHENQQYITSLAGKQESVPAPDSNAALDFWSNIWARPHNHRADAEWITEVSTEFVLNELPVCSTLFLCAHEHIYFMECALSQYVLLPLLMVHFVTRMYYYYYYYYY